MKKRMKGMCTLLLAGALAATLLPGLPSARAASAVDTNAECSLEISIANAGTNYGADYLDDLTEQPVVVNLYKVADIDVTGAYTADQDFAGMSFSSVSSTTTAEDWSKLAATAAGIVTDNKLAADQTITIAAGDTSKIETGLGVGLYLIVPETVTAANYTYTFDPSMVSLPNNYYYDETSGGNDTWVYDVVNGADGDYAINLKPEQTARLGSLSVTKTLDDYSATAGERATFIFKVSYTTPKGEIVEQMLTMAFGSSETGAANKKDLTVKKIPAGSTVTVEEVYSGAAYELVSDATVTVPVVAERTAVAEFENAHNGSPNGGYGIVNHFYNENDVYQNDAMYNTGGTVIPEEELK